MIWSLGALVVLELGYVEEGLYFSGTDLILMNLAFWASGFRLCLNDSMGFRMAYERPRSAKMHLAFYVLLCFAHLRAARAEWADCDSRALQPPLQEQLFFCYRSWALV